MDLLHRLHLRRGTPTASKKHPLPLETFSPDIPDFFHSPAEPHFSHDIHQHRAPQHQQQQQQQQHQQRGDTTIESYYYDQALLIVPGPGGTSQRTTSRASQVTSQTYETALSYQTSHSTSTRPVSTPVPTLGPPTPRGRTPSLLRTLAHHPSLSVLRSRRKSRTKLQVPPVSPAKDGTPWTLRKKKSLRGSRSIPRDLRLQGDGDHFLNTSIAPPLPSPNNAKRYTTAEKGKGKYRSTTPVPTAPSTTQEGHEDLRDAIFDTAATTQNVHLRLNFDLNHLSPPRRIRPISELMSPSKRKPVPGPTPTIGREPSPRHLSTPASPPSRNVYDQDPRISLPPSRAKVVEETALSPSKARQSSYALYDDDDDNESLLDPIRPSLDRGIDDGLEVMRVQEKLPSGTPGGSRAELSRGVLKDGVRPENGAIRFFSRDTYTPMDGFSPSPTPSPARNDLLITSTPNHNIPQASTTPETFQSRSKRSSSPFEIKLSPNVTKRMSLDAFGTPGPPPDSQDQSGIDDRSIEELLEDEEEEEDIPYDEILQNDDRVQVLSNSMADFEATRLSMISERAETVGDNVSIRTGRTNFEYRSGEAETPAQLGCMSRYYTPSSPTIFANYPGAHPIPQDPHGRIISTSPFVPPPRMQNRKHKSAPPLEGSTSIRNGPYWIDVSGSTGVNDSLLLEEYRAENEVLRETIRGATVVSKDARQQDLEEEREKELQRLQVVCREQETALLDLRTAMVENESAFEEIQSSQEELFNRNNQLESENISLRERLSSEINSTRSSSEHTANMQTQLEIMDRTNGQLIRTLAESKGKEEELRQATIQAQKHLEVTTKEMQSAITKAQNELRRALWEVGEKEKVIVQLRDKLQIKSYESDERMVVAQRQIMELQNDFARSMQDLERVNAEKQGLEKDVRELERLEKDWFGEKLRMSSQLEQSQKNRGEEISSFQEQVDNLTEQLAQAEQWIGTLEADREDIIERLETATSTITSQDEQITSLKETLQQTEKLQDQNTHLSKNSERTIQRLQNEIEDLQNQLSTHTSALQNAVTEKELAKSQSGDVRSRLDAYLSEIDRLKLSEATLSHKVENLQRQSAGEELEKVNLQKKVAGLEEDKELLNVALESKQTELILFQRQLPTHGSKVGAPTTPRANRLAQSTGTIGSARKATTPLPTPRQSVPASPTKRVASGGITTTATTATLSSASKVTSKSTRRESSIMGPPRSSISMGGIASTKSGNVLGSTTKYNQLPKESPSVGNKKSNGDTVKPVSGIPVLRRQTSLPVLTANAKLQGDLGARRVTSMIQEDGEEGAL